MGEFSIRAAGSDDIEPMLDQLEAISEERKWIASVPRSHYRRQNGELWDAIVMGLLL